MRMPQATGFLVPPESGRVNALHMLAKVTERQSRGALFIYERTLQPESAVPRHVHASDDECAYVLSGEIRCAVGHEAFLASAGAYVVKPRGIAHECVNDNTAPAHLLEIAVSGRIEGFYRELAALVGEGDDEPAGRSTAVEELSLRYGIRWLGPAEPSVPLQSR